MAQDRKVLTIFASSPGDVVRERKQVEEVVRELNALWSRFLRFQIDLLQDATHTFPGVGSYAQEVVNRQIGDDYDIYLGIMGERFGSPTAVAGSGTQEEFERALARRHENQSSVDIMFFFRRPPPNIEASQDQDQRSQVEAFRRRIGDQGVYYRMYRTLADFTALIRLSLTLALQEWLQRNNVKILTDALVDTEASQYEAHETQRKLDEIILEMDAVVRRFHGAIERWNADVAAGHNIEDILAQAITDLTEFSKDLKPLAPHFSAEYLHFLDTASRIASALAVPHENKKAALTLLLILLHLIDSKRAKAHQGLVNFHHALGNIKATSSALAKALSGALEAVEEVLGAFAEARDELASAVATIEAIRDLS